MCTAVCYRPENSNNNQVQNSDTYFGRNLDLEFSYSEDVTITPRNYHFPLRNGTDFQNKYAICGVAFVVKDPNSNQDYPLYYDAFNEAGLGMAGLNFVGYAHYGEPAENKDNITQFEFIPWILGQCANIQEARQLLEKINLTNTPFSEQLPPAELHWMLSDARESIVVESMLSANGTLTINIHDNPVGVLTNNPPFNEQLFLLNNYAHVSASSLGNRFSNKIQLTEYSRGMGGIGLPGDLSSQSRFVRSVFTALNSKNLNPKDPNNSNSDEYSSVTQFFHILDSVKQTYGCCNLGSTNTDNLDNMASQNNPEDAPSTINAENTPSATNAATTPNPQTPEDKFEYTVYSSCANLNKGIFYYTTYENRQITAIDIHKCNLDGAELIRFPFVTEQKISWLA